MKNKIGVRCTLSPLLTQETSTGYSEKAWFWISSLLSFSMRTRLNTSHAFLGTSALDANIVTTNQDIEIAWNISVYWFPVNKNELPFRSCCSIWYVINSMETVCGPRSCNDLPSSGPTWKKKAIKQLRGRMFNTSYSLHANYIGNYGNHIISDFGPSCNTTYLVENCLLLLKIKKNMKFAFWINLYSWNIKQYKPA